MAIMAVLATHEVGAIPEFPSIDHAYFNQGKGKEYLAKGGETTGCINALHRHIREETDNTKDYYRYHIGGWLAKCVKATFNFLNNSSLEKQTRWGVGCYKDALSSEDYTMPPDPSVVKMTEDGMYCHVPIVTLDNRYGRKLPRPVDFSSDSYTIKPSPMLNVSELVELGSFPLLGVIHRSGLVTEPSLPMKVSPSNVIEFQTNLKMKKDSENRLSNELKENDNKRPKLPLPIPYNSSTARSPIGSAMIKRFEQSSVDYTMRLNQIKRESYNIINLNNEQNILQLFNECTTLLKETIGKVGRESKELEYHLNRNTVQPKNSDKCGYTGVTGKYIQNFFLLKKFATDLCLSLPFSSFYLQT
jgi:hypothetical protein